SDREITLSGRIPGPDFQRLFVEGDRLGGLALPGEYDTEVVQRDKGVGINGQGTAQGFGRGGQITFVHRFRGLLQVRVQVYRIGVRRRRLTWICSLRNSAA